MPNAHYIKLEDDDLWYVYDAYHDRLPEYGRWGTLLEAQVAVSGKESVALLPFDLEGIPDFILEEPREVQYGPRRKRGKGNKYHRFNP